VSSQQLRITLAGREHVTEAGTTAGAALDGGPGVIAARVNGVPRDLAHVLADGDVVEPIINSSDEGHAILRHSTAHVLAQAVQDLQDRFPQARLGIGPPVENGFYYDFDVSTPFSPDDLKAIEARMREIVKQGQLFSRRVVTDAEARDELKSEPYKLELIGLKGSPAADAEESVEVGGPELTIYDNLDPKTGAVVWKDLCRGPHVPSTRAIPAFGAARRTRSCSGSTAPPGRPAPRRTITSPCSPRRSGATTGGWERSSTCSPSRTRSGPGCRCSIPRAASSAG
jgi:threonyl-tRNA synthetase